MIIENSHMTIKPIIGNWALSERFLHGRMSFICGPRQIGRTTLIQSHLRNARQEANYFNWDSLSVRREFARNPHFFIENLRLPSGGKRPAPWGKRPWVAFDEIHKYPRWKNLLKGYYDEWKGDIRFVVTGSARLDFFRRSGDSLVGRYFLFRMNPLHPRDLNPAVFNPEMAWHPRRGIPEFDPAGPSFSSGARVLLEICGYPEPLSVGTREFYRRWKDNHISLITGEDLRDLTKIASIQKLQTLLFLLPERVGSPLSLNSLKDTLQCAHATVQSWLEALEKVFLLFSLSPFAGKLKRSVIKEKKYYFWDWGIHDEPGKRFENFLAVQLQRAVSAWNEWGKGDYRLMFVRTKDGRELDFVVVDQNRPLLIVECKWSEKSLAPSVVYFKERLSVPLAIQVSGTPGGLRQYQRGVFIIGYDRFLSLLP